MWISPSGDVTGTGKPPAAETCTRPAAAVVANTIEPFVPQFAPRNTPVLGSRQIVAGSPPFRGNFLIVLLPASMKPTHSPSGDMNRLSL